MPVFTVKAFAGEDITIFGDGEQTRDFICAKDIAKALHPDERPGDVKHSMAAVLTRSVSNRKMILLQDWLKQLIFLNKKQINKLEKKQKTVMFLILLRNCQ